MKANDERTDQDPVEREAFSVHVLSGTIWHIAPRNLLTESGAEPFLERRATQLESPLKTVKT
ncbi:MAG: hypothetical protein K0S79_1982 [Nitrospira sp.]|jgi:hypothetical protein|nr:hypothetical protein [Nitrospira sp.]MDF2459566.1 hypothetical protein [Nitrospira sp.]